jgi:hypothetical protein
VDRGRGASVVDGLMADGLIERKGRLVHLAGE